MTSNMTVTKLTRVPIQFGGRQLDKEQYALSCHFNEGNCNAAETLPDAEIQYDDAGADIVAQWGRVLFASLSGPLTPGRETCRTWSYKPSCLSIGCDEIFGLVDSSTPYFGIDTSWMEGAWLGSYKPEWLFDESESEAEALSATAMGNIRQTCDIALTGWTRPDGIETLIDNLSRSVYRKPAIKELEEILPTFASRIRHLQELEPDWDGNGGVPITDDAVDRAAIILAIASRLDDTLEEPFIAPLPNGGLQIEWEVESGKECLVVIPPDGTDVEYLLETPTASGDDFDATEGFLKFRNNGFRNLISQFTG